MENHMANSAMTVQSAIMENQMITFVMTVLGGVLIFVVGQILLKLVIEPTQELKKALASVGNKLLLHQAQITNASFNRQISLEIESKSAEIISKSSVVLGYGLVRIIFRLPTRENILLASRELNRISYGMREESKEFEESSAFNTNKTNFPIENTKAVQKIGKLLNLQTSYSD